MRLFAAIFCLTIPPVCFGQQATQPPPPTYQDSITVLGTSEPTTQGQATRLVETIPATPRLNLVTDPTALLRLDSSVDVQTRGPMGVQSDITLRGGSFEQTLILLNGLRINDPQTSHFNFDIPIPFAALAGIDILHGSGSTLYGSDAISGAVNVRTLQPDSTSLWLHTGIGSYGINQQAAQATATTPGKTFLLSGERDFSSGFIPDRDYRSESLAAQTRLHSPLGTSDILAAASDRHYGADQFYGNYPSWERTKGWYLLGSQDLGHRTTLSAAYRRHTDVFDLFRNQPAIYENNHIANSAQILLRRSDTFKEKFHLYSGLDNNLDQIASNALGRHGTNRSAAYLQPELRTPRLYLSAALRVEVIGGYGVVSAPGFSGSYMLTPRLKARASIGYGFRLPTFTDKYYADPTTQPNPALKPESAWSYDGGFDLYLTPRLTLTATGYTSRQSNAIDYVRPDSQSKYQAQNLSHLQLTGAELALHATLPHAQLLNLAYTSTTGAQAALGTLQSRYLYNFPSHNASAEYLAPLGSITTRIRVSATQRYNTTAYATLDISANRNKGVLRPWLQFTNLTNTGYQELAGIRTQGRAFTGGLDLQLTKHPK